jgi:hypothetical protein
LSAIAAIPQKNVEKGRRASSPREGYFSHEERRLAQRKLNLVRLFAQIVPGARLSRNVAFVAAEEAEHGRGAIPAAGGLSQQRRQRERAAARRA